jgi:outer membrane protein
LTSLALQQRPELTRYRAEADAARAAARAARDARLPTISVIAAAGYVPVDHPQFDTKYAAGGFNLNVPLFAGGLYRSRQREAELQANVADAATQDTVNTITRDVRLAWLEAVHARERIALTARLAENANAALTLARARFEQGLASTVELTQAELAHTSAEIAQSTADYAYRVRREILDYQTGTLR